MRRSVAHNSFFGTFGRVSVKVIAFFFSIVIVRWLGNKSYGQYSLVWSFVIIFSILSDAGLSMFAIREIAQKSATRRSIPVNIIFIRIILAFLSMGLIAAAALTLGYSKELVHYIFLASTILLLYAFQDTFEALLQAHERFDLSSVAVVAGQIFFVVAGLLCLFLGGGITGLIFVGLLNVVVVAVLNYYFIRQCRIDFEWTVHPQLWPGFLRASFSFGLLKLWLSWLLKIDVVILSLFWIDEMVGWYSAAYALVLGVVTISNAISAALYPVMSRYYVNSTPSLQEIYETALKYLLLISMLAAGTLSITADQVVSLLYGPTFGPMAMVLAVLVWIIPLTFTSEFFRYVLIATDREKIAVQVLGLAVVFNVILNLLFIPQYGFFAAALIAVATEALLVLTYVLHLKSEIKPVNLKKAFLRPAIVAISVMVALRMLREAPFTVEILSAGAVAAILILALRLVDLQDYEEVLNQFRFFKDNYDISISDQPPPENIPLVSVFIPAFNASPYVEKAVNSVLAQTYNNFELIIIDDGSTDNTWQILQQYQSCPQISIYQNSKNLGMAPTWNLGLDYAQGQWVAKLDADDFYERGFLRTVVDFFQRNDELGLVFSGVNLIYPDGRIEPEMPYLTSRISDRNKFLLALLRLCIIRSPSVCVKKECFDRLGGFVEGMTIHADWEMWVRIAANYPVGYIARLLGNYRMSTGTNVTAQAVADGRSIEDLKLWLTLLQHNSLPYLLSPLEEHTFRWGIYELEMHFAAMAAHHHQPAVQKTYIDFAESVLPDRLSAAELTKMRQVYLDLHSGVLMFRERQLSEARRHFLRAIKTGPNYTRPLWIWSKLILTYLGRTKWGIMFK